MKSIRISRVKKQENLLRSKLLWSILVLPYFEPASYVVGTLGEYLFAVLLMLSCALTLYFTLKEKISIESWGYVLCVAYFVITLSTFISPYESDIFGQLKGVSKVIFFLLLVKVGLCLEADLFIDSFLLVGMVMLLLCDATMFLYKDQGGMNPLSGMTTVYGVRYSSNWYLMGHDTQSLFYFFPVLVVGAIKYAKSRYTFRLLFVALFVMTFCAYFYVDVASAKIVLPLFLLLILFFSRFGIAKYFSWIVVGGICALFAFVVLAQGVTMFSDALQSLLNRSSDLTGRFAIWRNSIFVIADNPILGVGTLTGNQCISLIGINHCHNMILEILFRGGIVALVIYLWCFAEACSGLVSKPGGLIEPIIAAGIVCFAFLSTIDFYIFNPVIMILLVLGSNSRLICWDR